MTKRDTSVLRIAAATVFTAAILTTGSAQDARAVDPANGKMLALSNVQRLASDAEVASAANIPSSAKRFLVPFRGFVKVRWQVKSSNGGTQVNVNVGSAVDACFSGPNQSTDSADYVQGSCALRVATGDIVEVTVASSAMGTNGLLRNVRLFYDVIPGNAVGKVLP
jgi:hypothetical protein